MRSGYAVFESKLEENIRNWPVHAIGRLDDLPKRALAEHLRRVLQDGVVQLWDLLKTSKFILESRWKEWLQHNLKLTFERFDFFCFSLDIIQIPGRCWVVRRAEARRPAPAAARSRPRAARWRRPRATPSREGGRIDDDSDEPPRRVNRRKEERLEWAGTDSTKILAKPSNHAKLFTSNNEVTFVADRTQTTWRLVTVVVCGALE